MATLAMFDGIIVRMNPERNTRHHTPSQAAHPRTVSRCRGEWGLTEMVRYQTLKEAKATDDHHVAVVFDDGERGVFDCAPYFDQSYWSKLREPSFFKQAHIEYGHLTWPGDIDISPIEVWQDAVREKMV